RSQSRDGVREPGAVEELRGDIASDAPAARNTSTRATVFVMGHPCPRLQPEAYSSRRLSVSNANVENRATRRSGALRPPPPRGIGDSEAPIEARLPIEGSERRNPHVGAEAERRTPDRTQNASQ